MAEILNGGNQPLQRAYLGSNKVYDKSIEDKAALWDNFQLESGTLLFNNVVYSTTAGNNMVTVKLSNVGTNFNNIKSKTIIVELSTVLGDGSGYRPLDLLDSHTVDTLELLKAVPSGIEIDGGKHTVSDGTNVTLAQYGPVVISLLPSSLSLKLMDYYILTGSSFFLKVYLK